MVNRFKSKDNYKVDGNVWIILTTSGCSSCSSVCVCEAEFR